MHIFGIHAQHTLLLLLCMITTSIHISTLEARAHVFIKDIYKQRAVLKDYTSQNNYMLQTCTVLYAYNHVIRCRPRAANIGQVPRVFGPTPYLSAMVNNL